MAGTLFTASSVTLWMVYLLNFAARTNCFDYPQLTADVGLYSKIYATSTCSSSTPDVTCNVTCPGRTDFPEMFTPLSSTPGCEKVSEDIQNDAINKDNGHVQFVNAPKTCTAVTYNGSTGVDGTFTLTFWVKPDCTSW